MKKISRRNFLLASGVVTIGAALAACGFFHRFFCSRFFRGSCSS